MTFSNSNNSNNSNNNSSSNSNHQHESGQSGTGNVDNPSHSQAPPWSAAPPSSSSTQDTTTATATANRVPAPPPGMNSFQSQFATSGQHSSATIGSPGNSSSGGSGESNRRPPPLDTRLRAPYPNYDAYYQQPATASPVGTYYPQQPLPSAAGIRPPMSARPSFASGGGGGYPSPILAHQQQPQPPQYQQQTSHRQSQQYPPNSAHSQPGGFDLISGFQSMGIQSPQMLAQFQHQQYPSDYRRTQPAGAYMQANPPTSDPALPLQYQQSFSGGRSVGVRPPSSGPASSAASPSTVRGPGTRGRLPSTGRSGANIPPPIATGRVFVPSGGVAAGPASATALDNMQFLWRHNARAVDGRQQQQQSSQGAFPYSTITPTLSAGGATFLERDRPQSAVLPGERSSGYGLFSGGIGPISLPFASTTPSASENPPTPFSTSSSVPPGSARSEVPPMPMIRFPNRPDFGTKGRRLMVRANFFEFLTLPGQDIHHYEVRITPDVPPSLNRKIFRELESQVGSSELGGVIAVYDGRRNLYTPIKLPIEDGTALERDIVITDDDRPIPSTGSVPAGYTPRVFHIRVKHAARVEMDQLRAFLRGQLDFTPVNALQAMDVLMRQRPSMFLTTVGRSFFTRQGSKGLGDGVECWMGFHQSVRPAQGRLLVNVDVSATAFFEPGPILNFISRNLGKRGPTEMRAPLRPREIDKCERLMKGIKIMVTHRGEMRRKYKIHGFTRTPADETFFPFGRPNEHGETVERDISVAEYFATQYNVHLQYPFLPCLKVGSVQRLVFLPLEVCDIVPGQRYLRKLNEHQTAQMIRLTCQPPDNRASKISQATSELGIGNPDLLQEVDADFLKPFGVSVSDEMVNFPARVLDPPTIQYHPQSREPMITPRDGCWNLRDKRVIQPATLHSWAVICFGSPREMQQGNVDAFLREMISTCRDTGLTITNPHPPAIYGDPNGNIEATLHTAWQAAGEAVQSYPQLIICVLPNTGVPLYAEIKRIGDTILGVATQCVQVKHINHPKKQYCANVCLKINAKLGGVNSLIVQNPMVRGDDGLAWLSEEPTIIFGADITHPAHGEARTTGSVCALVGSLDRMASRYAATVRLLPPRRETILNLSEMVQELLKIFYSENNQIAPRRILFYRDGVSEGLFHEVATTELAAIRDACEKVQPGYRPAITFVVVQKRHHARVFTLDSRDADKSGNIPAGTVIDSHITHPNEFDFYLCSHAGLQGTSRPTHYHVLHDENGFKADALQQLTYRLCYGYARCTRSVSVVPPAYYADLVAFRAKYHMRGANYAGSMSGSMSAREETNASGLPMDQRTNASSVDDRASAAESEATSPDRRRKNRYTREDDELIMRRLQGRLAVVKPELQKVMYFM